MPVKKTTQVTKEDKTVKAPAKKAATKTTTVKKTAAKKKETSVEKETKTVKQTPTAKTTKTSKKTAAANKEVKAPAKKTASKKASEVVSKKVEQKKEMPKKEAPKKETVKKATPKKTSKAVKLAQYNNFAIDTCIDMARAMGVDMGYDQYANMLLEITDLKTIANNIIDKYDLKTKKFSFDEDGYDIDLIEVLVSKIADTVDIKAQDFIELGGIAKECLAYELSDDASANNDEYHKEFDLVKKILMIAQRKNLHTMEELASLLKMDMTDTILHYMDVAYNVLKNWQYDDVKYYENFIYAVLSHFTDLHDKYANRAMMDVADLYIEHGDYGLGDANYGYIIRENQIKDYIYYRYANVYVDIDREKARSIAQSALQYVDSRYTYYPNIMSILED
ncbi:neurofilament protein [Faecalitalea cylindroides]|uniref:neurofilament protein n=1 Tax=Faecalitalea cylindroides TaxID=39483 RepID=UPI002E79A85A|nr:neurofilament protein [Faecalitalea cylindroides]MEE1448633.1 neurofilament protein [Faecalitalea cylindroides]